jgi:hypothetical protein
VGIDGEGVNIYDVRLIPLGILRTGEGANGLLKDSIAKTHNFVCTPTSVRLHLCSVFLSLEIEVEVRTKDYICFDN